MLDLEKIAAIVRDVIVGEIKEEFRDFRASVTGELSGFRLAIESLNARMSNMEQELRDVRRSIDETRAELKVEIMANTARIDETNRRIDDTNKRIDTLQWDMSEMRGRIEKAISDKEVVHDILIRVERLEAGMAV